MKNNSNIEQWKAEIRELHTTLIQAHWDKDIAFFVKDIAPDYMTIKQGDLAYPTKEEIITKFTKYLNNTTFSEYKDLMEPMIEVAQDGSIAWSLVRVKIAGKRTQDDGSIADFDFVCAWITMYNHVDNIWVRKGEISTFR